MSATSEPTATAALAVRLPAQVTTAQEFEAAIAHAKGRCHVLTPFSSVSSIAPMHAVWLSVVHIDADKAAGDIYDNQTSGRAGGPKLPWLKDGEVALAKNGLRKIAEALGVDVALVHLSVGQRAHYWLVKAIATYKSLDGSVVTREASMEWDLRDGSDRIRGFTPNQIAEARKHGLRNCETRAINAAIRECGCGIKQAYRREELAKPFVALRVMFTPDYSDPVTRRLLTERALGGSHLLYGDATAAPLASPPALRPAFGDVVDVPTASEPPRGTTEREAEASGPPSPHAVRVVRIEEKHGTRADQSKWTLFLLVDHHGVEHGTFSRSIRDAAEQAMRAGAWVELVEDTSGDGRHRNVVELLPCLPDRQAL